MAEQDTKVKIVDIQVKYKDAISAMAQYRASIDEAKNRLKDLKKELKDGKITQEEYNKASESSRVFIKQQTDAINTLSRQVSNQIKTQNEQEGSLRQLRAELSNATAAYDAMSRAEREGAKGQELLQHINDITDELKGAEEASQRFYRNVGNYEGSIKSALGLNNSFADSLMEMASGGAGFSGMLDGIVGKVKAFGTTLLSMMGNPVFLAMAGIAGAGAAFKWFYDYNEGLVEATRLTQQFTGLTGTEMQSVRNEVQALSDSMGTEFAETLQTANAMAKAYGITVQEALKNIQDGFVSGGNASGELLDNVREYSTYLNEAGISAEGMVAISVQATKQGIFSDKGLDTIKEGNLRLREMTDSTAEALDGIGISSSQVQKELQSGSKTTFDIMQEVAAKLKELPPASKEVGTAIADIFGGPGEDAGLAYIKSLATIKTDLGEVKGEAGELAQAQEKQIEANKELSNVMSSLFDFTGGGFEMMKANLATIATKSLTSVIKGVVDVINYFIDLYNESTIVRGGVQVIGAQFKIVGNIIALVVKSIITALQGVGRSLKALGTMFEGLLNLLTLDFDKGLDLLGKGFSDLWSGMGKTFTEQIGNFKDFGKDSAQAVIDSINNTIDSKKIKHITIPASTNAQPAASVAVNSSKKYSTQGSNASPKTGSGGGNAGSSAVSDADKDRAKAAEEEAKLVAQAEKAMLDLLGECAEKRRAMLEAQYNGEINTLKAKLATDKTLTEKSKDAINQLITLKQQELKDKLTALDEAEIKRQIEDQQKLINSRLSVVRQGSEDELNLKIEQSKKQLYLDLLELGQQEDAAKEGAETSLMYRQQQLAELEKSGTATKEQLDEARNAVEYAQSEIYRINDEYAEMRLNRQQQQFDEEDALRRAHDQAVFDEQQQVLQNELAQLDLANAEKQMRESQENPDGMTLDQNLQQMGLDVVTDYEMQKLAIQQQMAQERLNFIMNQGQLETETEAQFNARVIAGKQAVADSKMKINQASIKNEQVYAKAMANVGDSLIGLLDTIGEHDKNFAMLSKIITLFKITVDTGKALSSGIASAMELPFPANLAAVATTVATVLTNIGTAISTVNSAKFAEGGKVYGPGTGTSDSIPANLSNGEFVMTAKATSLFEPLLVAMNAIGRGIPMQVTRSYERLDDADMLQQSFVTAVENIRPVVSVEEITDTQRRVEVIQNLDTF